MADKTIRVFNIQRYSLHDGSGIRTVVFLKGCPLRCLWCCNPESQREEPELMFRKMRCIGREKCGLCREAAPEGALSFDKEGLPVISFEKCRENLDWTKICPCEALCIEGKDMTVDGLLDLVEADEPFFRRGNGGLTLSGGEPLLQENALLVLQQAKERHLHTAIETCGHIPRERLLRAAEYLDEIFFDIKSVNDTKHRQYTGVAGSLIRENLRSLASAFPDKKISVRTPVIPGFNDSEGELQEIEDFLWTFPRVTWEKLPYHTYGAGKYEMLGRHYWKETGK